MVAFSPHESPGGGASGPLLRREPRQQLDPLSLPLGVPEACVVASGCGGNVTRLEAGPSVLLQRLAQVGPVAMFTRNAAAGLEVRSVYGPLEDPTTCGAAATRLLLRPEAWAHLFLVRGGTAMRPARTLAVFAPDGTPVHELQVEGEATQRLDALVADLVSADQAPAVALFRERIRAGERRLDVVRFARGGRSWEVALWCLGAVLDRAARLGTAIAITVANEGLRHRWHGVPPSTPPAGPWATVLDATTRLLVRRDRVTQAWVARRHVVGGTVTTLELFDGEGHAVVVVSAAGPRDDASWLEIVGALPRRWALA